MYLSGEVEWIFVEKELVLLRVYLIEDGNCRKSEFLVECRWKKKKYKKEYEKYTKFIKLNTEFKENNWEIVI